MPWHFFSIMEGSHVLLNHARTNIQHTPLSPFTMNLHIIFLLLLLKRVGSARPRESDIHPISPETPAQQYQPIDRKKRKGKIVDDNSRDRAAYANKKTMALILKPASSTPSNTRSARSFQRDTERRIKVLWFCLVGQ